MYLPIFFFKEPIKEFIKNLRSELLNQNLY